MRKLLVVGGGIGGLSTALACARVGVDATVFERAAEFAEVGAGIQLGPNVVKVLDGWGLRAALTAVAAHPDRLQVRCAISGAELGVYRLGKGFEQRYGAPYLTIHRADLQALLLTALQHQGGVLIEAGRTATGLVQTQDEVRLQLNGELEVQGDVLVAADGLWSQIRQCLLNDGVPQPTGHLAYRAMVEQRCLPERLRCHSITAWLGPNLHVVQYPVRNGQWLNLVAIVHGQVPGERDDWDNTANTKDIQRGLANTCSPLRELIAAVEQWRLWPLSIRAPMSSAQEHARGRVALLGDAAHPMVPYLAQGAGMAIEDAAVLAEELSDASGSAGDSIEQRLSRYAARRWRRNARVQARAIRNGEIFHATGLMRLGRNAAMAILGQRLLDMPWLYQGA